jgi:uncharacterized protein YjbI with pentapeptide repeats
MAESPHFRDANLSGANLTLAVLEEANLNRANLRLAVLEGTNLQGCSLIHSDLTSAVLTSCRVYGVSAWNLELDKTTKQQDLIITHESESEITVDNIEVAQFIGLLLSNEKICDVIDKEGGADPRSLHRGA